MSPSERSLYAAAFDAFPASVGVVDDAGTLVELNDAWRERGCEASLDAFPAEAGVDYLGACARSDDVSGAIEAVLGGADVRTLVQPFQESRADGRFLFAVAGFEQESSRYALVVFVDATEFDDDALKFRERLRRLEASVSVLSHDVRNPLAVADGFAQQLDDDSEAVDRVRQAIARADNIIDDALVLAQSGAVNAEPVDLRVAVRDAWRAVDAVTDAATLRFEGATTIRADRALLQRVFENLFANAVQHAGENVTVRVGVLEESEVESVGFYVADDGPGLPETEVADVFTAGVTTDHEDGNGLGLTIVDEVVRAHGWAVTATNGAEGGARFEVTGVTSCGGAAARE